MSHYYAQINNGIVTAVTQTAGPIDAPHMVAIDGLRDIGGYSYDPATGDFTPPAPFSGVPQSVTAFQAKAALLQADLLDDVEALMADPATPRIVKLAWTEALTVERQSPTVVAMGSALDLTDEQLDALFVAGSQITA